MKYLIAGLGNIGEEYKDTRHNMGFIALDDLAGSSNAVFNDLRYGSVASFRYKARTFILLKPSTFMNLSGNAVSYWMKKEKIPVENLLVIVDDIAIPFGSFRMRSGGSPGGHNGLSHISSVLGTDDYARIRIGIGNNFTPGRQSSYVLGKLTPEEKTFLSGRIKVVSEMIKSFGTLGTELTMTRFNKEGKSAMNDSHDSPE
ncbi:MAG: aminoacyl-tRNA hydrolase [Bacteroidales bacterium]|nr:aminoacyl-tRNA hydrolase [Bacteroidales bacterium]